MGVPRSIIFAAVLLALSAGHEIGKLKVLDVNMWGLPESFGSKDKRARFHALRDIVTSHPEYDVILLQEVWLHEDYDTIRKAVPYATDFGFYRNCTAALMQADCDGLAILSRHEIEAFSFLPFR